MSDATIVGGWSGRELQDEQYAQPFAEWVAILGTLSADGEIGAFETVALAPGRRGFDGFTLVYGVSPDATRARLGEELQRLHAQATLEHETFGVIWVAEDGLETLELLGEAVAEYGREFVHR